MSPDFIDKLFTIIFPWFPYCPVISGWSLLVLYKFSSISPFSLTLSIDISNFAPFKYLTNVSPLRFFPSFINCNDISPDFWFGTTTVTTLFVSNTINFSLSISSSPSPFIFPSIFCFSVILLITYGSPLYCVIFPFSLRVNVIGIINVPSNILYDESVIEVSVIAK